MTVKIKNNVIENLQLLMGKIFDEMYIPEDKRKGICENVLNMNNNLGNITKYNILKNDNFDLLDSMKADISFEMIKTINKEDITIKEFNNTISSSLSKVIIDLNNIYTRSYYNIVFDINDNNIMIARITDSAQDSIELKDEYLRQFISKIVLAITSKVYDHPSVDLSIDFEYLDRRGYVQTYEMKIGVSLSVGILYKYIEHLTTIVQEIGDPILKVDQSGLINTLHGLINNKDIKHSYSDDIFSGLDTSTISPSGIENIDFSKLYPSEMRCKRDDENDDDVDEFGFTSLY